MSTVPQVTGLSIYRGDTFPLTVRFWDDSAKTIPTDVSGRTFACQMRTAPGVDPAIDCEIDMSDSSTGAVHITLAPEVTAMMSASKYVCDFQQTIGSVVKTLWGAKIPVKADVTQ